MDASHVGEGDPDFPDSSPIPPLSQDNVDAVVLIHIFTKPTRVRDNNFIELGSETSPDPSTIGHATGFFCLSSGVTFVVTCKHVIPKRNLAKHKSYLSDDSIMMEDFIAIETNHGFKLNPSLILYHPLNDFDFAILCLFSYNHHSFLDSWRGANTSDIAVHTVHCPLSRSRAWTVDTGFISKYPMSFSPPFASGYFLGLQLFAAEGSSGSPVFDKDGGCVIGMICSVFPVKTDGGEHYTFALCASSMIEAFKELLELLGTNTSCCSSLKMLLDSLTKVLIEYGFGFRKLDSSHPSDSVNNMNSMLECPSDLPSQLSSHRSLSLRLAGDDDAEYSLGLLDLLSFDTELIHEISGHLYDTSSSNELGIEESDALLGATKTTNRANSVAKIKVVVRKRPLNKKEIAKKEDDIITIEPSSNALIVHETKLKVDLAEYIESHEFVFDAVLPADVSNDEVYAQTVEPIIPLVFQKTNATCFAYGQAGSGKTYTMQPLPLRASQDMLRLIHNTYRNQGFQLSVSFFEICGGKLFDLLSDRKGLFIREDGKKQVCIIGLQEYKVHDVETISDLIEKGNSTRSTGTTGDNKESSRSHAVLQLAIKRSADDNDLEPPQPVGKLSFVDLAGSEGGADTTNHDKQTRRKMEGAEINKSLRSLKECVRALDNDQNQIPFRGSKLTDVLRDSVVGNSRTIMISCISPNTGSCEHTLNTLRYADRVRSLSKGNNSKRDWSSSTSKDSNSQPLTSGPEQTSNVEDIAMDGLHLSGRFVRSRELERESSPSPKIECVSSGRADTSFIPGDSDYRGQRRLVGMAMYDYGNSEVNFEQKKFIRATNRKAETQNMEGEDLVAAHIGLIEETMDLVKEEKNLLTVAEQHVNHVDDYT